MAANGAKHPPPPVVIQLLSRSMTAGALDPTPTTQLDIEISLVDVGEACVAALGGLLPKQVFSQGRRFDDVLYRVLLSEDDFDLSAGYEPLGRRQKRHYRRASRQT